MGGSGQMAAGLILGALIGSAAGLLLAPRTGRENREMLRERMKRNRRRVESQLEDALSSRETDYLP